MLPRISTIPAEHLPRLPSSASVASGVSVVKATICQCLPSTERQVFLRGGGTAPFRLAAIASSGTLARCAKLTRSTAPETVIAPTPIASESRRGDTRRIVARRGRGTNLRRGAEGPRGRGAEGGPDFTVESPGSIPDPRPRSFL